MDLKRIIMMSALAFIAYVLVIKWNEDYGQPVATANVSETISSADMPSVDAPAASNDLPSASSSAGDTPTAPAGSASNSDKISSGLISVSSDKLDLRIDLKGGDILYAALPNHKERLDSPEKPFVMLENNSTRTYTAMSGLIGTDGPDASKNGRPMYTATAKSYELGDKDTLNVDLHTSTDKGVEITKRFTLEKGSNLVKVSYLINNTSEAAFTANMFGQLKRDGSEDPSKHHGMGLRSYLGPVFSTQDKNYEKVTFENLKDGENFDKKSQDGWVAMLQHYFLTAWIPTTNAEKEQAGDQDKGVNHYTGRKSGSNYVISVVEPSFTVAPGQQASVDASLYIGPKNQDVLKNIAANLNLTVDYGWLWFIGQPLFAMLKFFHSIVGNWGIAIILTTLVVKAIFFYPSAMSYRSMAKMRKFAPQIQRMKEQFGDDRQKMSQAMMELYRKEKINPLGGCLPILIQMPVFIALYWVLSESVELRHAPFFGWIHDMSVSDPYFILPIIMGCTMFIQQKLNPTPPDPMQAKIMKFLPIVFTGFFLFFPAGLVLYWVVNNCLSITQQYIITRRIEGEGSKA
ncbi:membrane protein insertase YidC [Pokkaliibacter sp. CJK22405]|uniref:membrane protein insertase YidC n=1 Tax=Pokkaliibacter sp. CJK22405 TaxID=3384615 RepID=UPI00398552CE